MTKSRFYGSGPTSMYFFVWTIVFAIISLVMFILVQGPLPFVKLGDPMSYVMIFVPLAFAFIFSIPGAIVARGSSKRRWLNRNGTIVFGAKNVSIGTHKIKQDFVWTMFASYTMRFEYKDERGVIHYISQYVKRSNVDAILHFGSSNLPLSYCDGDVAFNEKVFEQMHDGDYYELYYSKVKPLLEIHDKMKEAAEKMLILVRTDLGKSYTIKNSQVTNEYYHEVLPAEDKKFIEDHYNLILNGGMVKFSKEEIDRVWSLVDDEKHHYGNNNKVKACGGFILYAQCSSKSTFANAMTPILEGCYAKDPACYALLGAAFNPKLGKNLGQANRQISEIALASCYLLTGKNGGRVDRIKEAGELKNYNSFNAGKIISGAYALRVINDGFKAEHLKDLFEFKGLDPDVKDAIDLYYHLKQYIAEDLKENKRSRVAKIDMKSALESILYTTLFAAIEPTVFNFNKFGPAILEYLQDIQKTK